MNTAFNLTQQNSQKFWGQHYTPELEANALMLELFNYVSKTNKQPIIDTIFDLGAGQGDLLFTAHQQWPKAKLLAVDVDRNNIRRLRDRFPEAKCTHTNALSYKLPKVTGWHEDSAAIAVANPPYGKNSTDPFDECDARKILRQVGLDLVVPEKRWSRELVFMAQHLRLLRPAGHFVIIMPYNIASAPCFAALRVTLMQLHGLYKAIELPSKTFISTDARTIALFMVKGAQSDAVEYLDSLENSTFLSTLQVAERLHGQYHARPATNELSLLEIGAEIRQGQLGKKEAERLGIAVFHTTHFKNYPKGVISTSSEDLNTPYEVARKGDILVARVGSRCVGKTAIVNKGTVIFSECVHRIRVPKPYQIQVFKALQSEKGMEWFQSMMHGTCAQVVSIRDLLKFTLKI
jgi:SAM-dependent methyltransferase